MKQANNVNLLLFAVVMIGARCCPQVEAFAPARGGRAARRAAEASSAHRTAGRFPEAHGGMRAAPTAPLPTTATTTSTTALFQSTNNSDNGLGGAVLKWFEKTGIWSSLYIAGFVFLFAILNPITVINTGEVGIVSQLGGLQQIDPGVHLVAPVISSLDRLSTKTNLLEIESSVPTREGLTVTLETAILYRLDASQVKDLYAKIGPAFEGRIIQPELASAVKGLTAESDAKALYTSGRSDIQSHLQTALQEQLGPRGIIVEDVLLKAVTLPEQLKDAIEAKAQAEQEAARMEFVLQKEQQEAERKAIEAEGIAEFQKIVTKGINKDLLQWKGIEATEKLAESDNTKVVIIGSGKGSLPLILNSGSE